MLISQLQTKDLFCDLCSKIMIEIRLYNVWQMILRGFYFIISTYFYRHEIEFYYGKLIKDADNKIQFVNDLKYSLLYHHY